MKAVSLQNGQVRDALAYLERAVGLTATFLNHCGSIPDAVPPVDVTIGQPIPGGPNVYLHSSRYSERRNFLLVVNAQLGNKSLWYSGSGISHQEYDPEKATRSFVMDVVVALVTVAIGDSRPSQRDSKDGRSKLAYVSSLMARPSRPVIDALADIGIVWLAASKSWASSPMIDDAMTALVTAAGLLPTFGYNAPAKQRQITVKRSWLCRDCNGAYKTAIGVESLFCSACGAVCDPQPLPVVAKVEANRIQNAIEAITDLALARTDHVPPTSLVPLLRESVIIDKPGNGNGHKPKVKKVPSMYANKVDRMVIDKLAVEALTEVNQ